MDESTRTPQCTTPTPPIEVGDWEFVADNVLRIPLPLPIPELKSVNCYALLGVDGVTLIDPGWVSEDTEKALSRALTDAGTSLDEVSTILVTHSHWDHYTQAYALHQQRNTTLLLGRDEQHSIRGWAELDGAFPIQVGLLDGAGAHEHARRLEAKPVADTEKHTAFGHPTDYLDGDENLALSGTVVKVLSTPGHTRGHLVFHDKTSNLMFSGDHVLPRITPSIAYERCPDRMALRSYLTSLRLLVDHAPGQMMPAHGNPQPVVHERAQELIDHHEARLREVHELIDAGASTGLEIASAMKWTRRNVSLNELAPDQQWTAILEAVAHADLLEWRGYVSRSNHGRTDSYRPI